MKRFATIWNLEKFHITFKYHTVFKAVNCCDLYQLAPPKAKETGLMISQAQVSLLETEMNFSKILLDIKRIRATYQFYNTS